MDHHVALLNDVLQELAVPAELASTIAELFAVKINEHQLRTSAPPAAAVLPPDRGWTTENEESKLPDSYKQVIATDIRAAELLLAEFFIWRARGPAAGARSAAPAKTVKTSASATTSDQVVPPGLASVKGVPIVKHGRQGAPKRRALFMSPNQELIIQAEDHYKTVKLNGVTAVRHGLEADPRSRGQLTGTAILRRTCARGNMHKSFSLIMPARTVDIECLTEEDCMELISCMTSICAALGWGSSST